MHQNNNRSQNQIYNSNISFASKTKQIDNTIGTYSQVMDSPHMKHQLFPRQYLQKQLSVKSATTNKRGSQFSRVSNLSFVDNQHNYSNVTEDIRGNYENIENILKRENNNLKGQNQLLLSEVHKLKNINRKYKQTCMTQKLELQAAREECEAQKRRADQMKQMILSRLTSLQAKIPSNGEANNTASECESLLQALNLSESMH